jgi:hypothetical protein
MIKQSFILMLFCIAIFACNSNNNKEIALNDANTQEIKTDARFISNEKLFDGIDLPVYTEKIKANKEEKLLIPTGAEIKVPANAFIDKAGNDVKGDVTIKYKEIKSAADIIIENVNMTYDSAGQSYQFVTAGMFDLRAYSGNEELQLKKGKSIEVSYISEKTGNYNVYYYNAGWKYSGVPKENVTINPIIPEVQNSGILTPTAANTQEDLIVDIKVDHKNIPELEVYKNVLWKYSGQLKNNEVAAMLGNPVSNTSILPSGKKGEYLYKFSTKNGDFSLPVKPVFSPKAMKEALNTYKQTLAKMNPVPKIKRTVDITKLGLMNYDAIYHRPDALVVNVEIKIKNNDKVKVQGLPLFHITGEDNVLVNIADKQEITYSKSLNNKIVAVLPGHKVAVMGTSEFLKAVQAKGNAKSVVIELNELEGQIKSPGDLNKIIAGL